MKTNKQGLTKITVKSNKKYDVIIARDILKDTGALIQKVIKPCKALVITDDIVDGLYSNKVISSLENSGFKVHKFVFANGEKSKNMDTFAQILSFLAKNQFTRTDCVVALGGGVVMRSSWMRACISSLSRLPVRPAASLPSTLA